MRIYVKNSIGLKEGIETATISGICDYTDRWGRKGSRIYWKNRDEFISCQKKEEIEKLIKENK